MLPDEQKEFLAFLEKHHYVLSKRAIRNYAAMLSLLMVIATGTTIYGSWSLARSAAETKAQSVATEAVKSETATAITEQIRTLRNQATHGLARIKELSDDIEAVHTSLGTDQPRVLAAGRVTMDGNIAPGDSVGLQLGVTKDADTVGRYFITLPSNYEHQDTYMIAIPATQSRRQRITVGWSRQHNGYVVNTTDNSQEQSLVAVRADSDFFFVLVGKHGQSERTAETEEDSQLGT